MKRTKLKFKRVFVCSIISVVVFAGAAKAQEMKERMLSLKQVIQLAREQSPAAKISENVRANRFYQYQFYRTNLRPQLSLSGSLPEYSKDVFDVRQPDGSLLFQRRNQLSTTLELSLSQHIPLTGGMLSLNTYWARFDDLNRDFVQYSGTPINISLFQPIFAFNELKWQKIIEPIKYHEASREYVQEMEEISQQAAALYFDVVDAQTDLRIAEINLKNNELIEHIETRRIDLGTTSKDKLLQIRLQVLTSKKNLREAQTQSKNAVLRLKNFIGIREDTGLELVLPDNPPLFHIDVETALRQAEENRPEFLAFQRRKLEAERDIAQAKGERFEVSLFAAYGLNNLGDRLADVYTHPNEQQRLAIGINVPILDWGRRKAKVGIAEANRRVVEYTTAQEEVTFKQEILALIENFELIKENIIITLEADSIGEERYAISGELYRMGKLSITDLNIALTEKDAAKRDYIQTLHNYWDAYFLLRSLTLYDFQNNQSLITGEL